MDRKERDAFAARVRDRDNRTTRKIATKADSRSAEVARRRLELEAARERLVPELREQSRREYLKKRAPDKIDELELLVQDDEILFGQET